MYVPHFNALEGEEEIRALVAAVGSAELVSRGRDGFPVATLLPVMWEADRLVLHMARANQHWRAIGPDTPALAIVAGDQAYVSPSWYPAKQEHGRVVPTWNYSAVHLTGTLTVHQDPGWLREAVSALTRVHESGRADAWAVTDAPPDYIDKQLKAIVGVEMQIHRVEAKAKLSQNRSEADQAGVVAGLRAEGGYRDRAVAEQMVSRRARPAPR